MSEQFLGRQLAGKVSPWYTIADWTIAAGVGQTKTIIIDPIIIAGSTLAGMPTLQVEATATWTAGGAATGNLIIAGAGKLLAGATNLSSDNLGSTNLTASMKGYFPFQQAGWSSSQQSAWIQATIQVTAGAGVVFNVTGCRARVSWKEV